VVLCGWTIYVARAYGAINSGTLSDQVLSSMSRFSAQPGSQLHLSQLSDINLTLVLFARKKIKENNFFSLLPISRSGIELRKRGAKEGGRYAPGERSFYRASVRHLWPYAQAQFGSARSPDMWALLSGYATNSIFVTREHQIQTGHCR
jgi:hypothetical protein